MSESVYEVLSLGMRYWFMLLGLLIVWRSFSWLRKDRREKHRRLRQLPDAGMIGELVVIVGSDELPEGTAIPVPREGVLGFLRTCDVVVPVSGVAAHHLDFTFRNGKGLLVRPWRGCTCQVDADEFDHRVKPSRYPMYHGSKLFIGDAVLRLRVFAGLDVTRYAEYMEDEEPAPQEESIPQDSWNAMPPQPWQSAPYGYPPQYQQPQYQQSQSWQDTDHYQPQSWQQPEQPYAPQQDPWMTSGYPQAQDAPLFPDAPAEGEPDVPYESAPSDDFAPSAPRVRRSMRRRYSDET